MELLVIRHGQSEADLRRCHEGRADFPLTELGLAQGKLLADWVKRNYPPDTIISSPLRRAAQTASLLASVMNMALTYDDDLMEYDNGRLAGLSYDEAAIRYPIQPESKRAYLSFYGQETLIAFRARAERVLHRIIHEYPLQSRVAVISHGGMINMLFRSFMNLPLTTDYGIGCGDTAVHLWLLNGGKRQIQFLNNLAHLHRPELG